MGQRTEICQGYIKATAPKWIKGAKIVFDKVTVGGTENTVMAAALTSGSYKLIKCSKRARDCSIM